nr:immunoglobulin heavy chain junction region [Macaca mulatta]MOW75869.1 immunoglobulin heavy chain junction region [Macaca mulatta]MOW76076.1 immunoglobulin heavy chain junction region [Macaca mulatta]MOW76222.1 immunoglobulin heavy chain junction region [Macaca mulatta]MOW77041.1 immunoglobulin heavy chain junction region [Macaca mulatta]
CALGYCYGGVCYEPSFDLW